jgi:ankyrin repeat protein
MSGNFLNLWPDAVKGGDLAAVARLLAAGADPNALVTGRNASGEVLQTTVLCEAAAQTWRLEAEAARLLLDGGADPSLADSNGFTPLMVAARTGYLEVLRLLLARGAAVDAVEPCDGATAFHYACHDNQAECAEALVQAGCEVGLMTKRGKTGREVAAANGHRALVVRLRALEAERSRAAQAAAGSEPEMAPSGEAIGHQLCSAAQTGDGPAVARLLAAGADPNALVTFRNASGEVAQTTALIAAVVNGRLEAGRLLLDGGADPSRAAGGITPLNTPIMAAVRKDHPEVLRLLLARGAAVDAVDPSDGATAFHYACYDNQPDWAEVLVLAGCDVGIKSKRGETGRQMAEREGHTVMVQRLRALTAERPPVGAVARVRGLMGAAEHNGKLAAVRRHLPEKGRFQLELLESGRRMDVKPANFELVIVPVGLGVEVRGLVGAAEHNGKQGVVESRIGENGRCGVRLPGRATPLGLKPANLQLANQAVSLEPEPAAGAGPSGGGALGPQLCCAAQTGDAAAVARLLAAGADPSALVTGRDASGESTGLQSTPLYAAARYGQLKAARVLLDAGAGPSLANSEGSTPLMLAAEEGTLEVLRLLLARGAAVDAVDPRDGCTAFHYACYNNHPGCAEALVQAGCDIGIKGGSASETGREMADVNGHAAVVERLRALEAEWPWAAMAATLGQQRQQQLPFVDRRRLIPVSTTHDGGPAMGAGAAICVLLNLQAFRQALRSVPEAVLEASPVLEAWVRLCGQERTNDHRTVDANALRDALAHELGWLLDEQQDFYDFYSTVVQLTTAALSNDREHPIHYVTRFQMLRQIEPVDDPATQYSEATSQLLLYFNETPPIEGSNFLARCFARSEIMSGGDRLYGHQAVRILGNGPPCLLVSIQRMLASGLMDRYKMEFPSEFSLDPSFFVGGKIDNERPYRLYAVHALVNGSHKVFMRMPGSEQWYNTSSGRHPAVAVHASNAIDDRYNDAMDLFYVHSDVDGNRQPETPKKFAKPKELAVKMVAPDSKTAANLTPLMNAERVADLTGVEIWLCQSVMAELLRKQEIGVGKMTTIIKGRHPDAKVSSKDVRSIMQCVRDGGGDDDGGRRTVPLHQSVDGWMRMDDAKVAEAEAKPAQQSEVEARRQQEESEARQAAEEREAAEAVAAAVAEEEAAAEVAAAEETAAAEEAAAKEARRARAEQAAARQVEAQALQVARAEQAREAAAAVAALAQEASAEFPSFVEGLVADNSEVGIKAVMKALQKKAGPAKKGWAATVQKAVAKEALHRCGY